jgi:hypothetical protein
MVDVDHDAADGQEHSNAASDAFDRSSSRVSSPLAARKSCRGRGDVRNTLSS